MFFQPPQPSYTHYDVVLFQHDFVFHLQEFKLQQVSMAGLGLILVQEDMFQVVLLESLLQWVRKRYNFLIKFDPKSMTLHLLNIQWTYSRSHVDISLKSCKRIVEGPLTFGRSHVNIYLKYSRHTLEVLLKLSKHLVNSRLCYKKFRT